jgi:hypothetical protein
MAHAARFDAANDGGVAGETHVRVGRLELLRYLRRGADPAAPLVVFLPGAGHLGRVAYGHRGGNPRDFLDHWLAEARLGLLALSYPGVSATADLSLVEWAEAVVLVASDALEGGPRAIVLLAWSMAARGAGLLAATMHRRGVAVAGFVPMAASPPVAGLSSVDTCTEIVDADGLWNVHDSPVGGGVARGAAWSCELAAQAERHGRAIIAPADYRDHYRIGTPIGLMPGREPDAACDLAAFPLAAPLSPRDPSDYRHALGDAAIWGLVNTLVMRRRWIEPALARGPLTAPAWEALLALTAALPQRLNRHVPGGHLFFIGERGARASVQAITALLAETRAVTAELDVLVSQAGHVP